MGGCVNGSTSSKSLMAFAPELKDPGTWIRLILIILVIILIAYIIHENKDWYCGLCKPSWNLSSGWMIFFWIIFAVLFVWIWSRGDLCMSKNGASRWATGLFFAVFILVLAWVVDLFWVHDICAARYIILAATILMAIQTALLWKYDRVSSGIAGLLTIWLIYVTAVTWNYSCEEEHSEDGSRSHHESSRH